MGVMWVRGAGSTTLCNWFSKPESSEVAAHMELNFRKQPYWHFHNPLPISQQTPWQTEGSDADNPLSEQEHIAVIARCFPSMPLIGFLLTGQPVSRALSICFLAARATLQPSKKMTLQTQVAPICFTEHMPVNTVQWVRASGPLVLPQAQPHLSRGSNECVH